MSSMLEPTRTGFEAQGQMQSESNRMHTRQDNDISLFQSFTAFLAEANVRLAPQQACNEDKRKEINQQKSCLFGKPRRVIASYKSHTSAHAREVAGDAQTLQSVTQFFGRHWRQGGLRSQHNDGFLGIFQVPDCLCHLCEYKRGKEEAHSVQQGHNRVLQMETKKFTKSRHLTC